ncbi:MAG: DNA polymerase III subunit chi, partial [Parvibaculum sp.]
MTEVLFYHLQNVPLEKVLPQLLEKSLERGWRAIVRAGGPERLEAINSLLWTYSDDSFLPH